MSVIPIERGEAEAHVTCECLGRGPVINPATHTGSA